MRNCCFLILAGLFHWGAAQSSDWQQAAADYFEVANSDDPWFEMEVEPKGRQLLAELGKLPEIKESKDFMLLSHYWTDPLTVHSTEQLEPLLGTGTPEDDFILLVQMGAVYPQAATPNPYLERALVLADASGFSKVEALKEYAHWQSGYGALKWIDQVLHIFASDKASAADYVECAGIKANILFGLGELEDANEWQLTAQRGEVRYQAQNDLEMAVYERSFPHPDYSNNPEWVMALMFQKASGAYGHSQAARLFEKSLKEMEGSTIQSAVVALQAAQSYLALKNPEQAIPLLTSAYQTLMQKRTTTDHLVWAINARMQLGVALFRTGKFEEAYGHFHYLDQLLERSGVTGSDFRFATIHNLILTSHALKSAERIAQHTQDFLKMERRGVADDNVARLYAYGTINAATGDDTTAYALFKRCYDLQWSLVEFAQMDEDWDRENDPDYDPEWDNMIGEEDLTLQIGTEQDAYLIRKKPMDPLYVPLLKELAQGAFRTGNYAEAQNHIIEYVNEYYTALVWQHDHAGTGSDLFEIYRLKEELFPMYDLYLMSLIYLEKEKGVLPDARKMAFNQTMDSKSNLQYEFQHIRQSILQSDEPALKQLYDDYLAVREQWGIAARDGQSVDSLRIAMNQLRLELSQQSSKFKSGQKRFVYWNQVQEKLGKKEALIELRRIADPSSGKVLYVAFVLKAGSVYPEMVVMDEGEKMEKVGFAKYQNSIKYKLEDKASYDVFWAPLQPHLAKIKTVYLASEGIYSRINVSGLLDPTKEKYVADVLKVKLIISAKQLLEPEQTNRQLRKAVLMGRPTYQIEDWLAPPTIEEMSRERALTRDQITQGTIADLPGTEEEVTTVGNLLQQAGVEAQVYLHQASSEENFKSFEGDLLHVATHGFWFDVPEGETLDPMLYSGLLFAGVKNHLEAGSATGNDGILTAYEIQGMSLDRTQLAVLSACETGLGKIEIGEGVFGLQRAFTIAGVDKLIMSLWKVDDSATQQLFTTFYDHWIRGGKPLTEAFALAQQVLREKYPHPYYWAAFVLVD